ncbi:PASTA domain-containing protein [Micromonospora sp. 15K316]|uniref:PASTA domain-containing protein n=1 Tax=Micromonospora sp. 15K316 TaxID=2530376 RepID=UPI00104BFB74|nr:PASTA domain-containing protein [Micromonospora sp. 15K316]TDC35616.1 PASTA domain-containing protein [Micromonospora sp. 15K316]
MSDDRQEPPADDRDETRPLPRSGGEPDDQTQRLPGPTERAGAGSPEPPDATAPLGRPADRSVPSRPERVPPWSGRAEVRPPRPSDYPEPAGEWYAEDQGGRRWWLPILWGILALLLVALLGVALWLLSNAADERPGPEPTPSPSLTTVAPTSASPTSAEPTTESPSSVPPTPTEAVEVPVPPLTGLTRPAAEALLDRLGLSYRVEFRPSELPPGRVIGTDPAAGVLVAEDEEIALLISRTDPTSAAPTGPPTSGPTTTATP